MSKERKDWSRAAHPANCSCAMCTEDTLKRLARGRVERKVPTPTKKTAVEPDGGLSIWGSELFSREDDEDETSEPRLSRRLRLIWLHILIPVFVIAVCIVLLFVLGRG